MKTKVMTLVLAMAATVSTANADAPATSWYCTAQCVSVGSGFTSVGNRGTVRANSQTSIADAFSRAQNECLKKSSDGALVRKVRYTDANTYRAEQSTLEVEFAAPADSCVQGVGRPDGSASGGPLG